MKKVLPTVVLILLASCSHRLEDKWSYSGDHAPYAWGKLDKSFKSCGTGKTQSPINLQRDTAQSVVAPIDFSYENLAGHAVNDGKTIRLEFEDRDNITLSGKRYFLKQLHFHAKSEHSIEGLFYPAEMHLVHVSEDGDLLVLGFFIRIDDKHSEHYGFFKSLPKEGETRQTQLISLTKLSAFNGPHYMYKGSLTTPPCTEGVTWVIFEKPLVLSSKQLASFSSIYSSNYRPIVPITGHKIFYSK
jgi:carbonic anhydrase